MKRLKYIGWVLSLVFLCHVAFAGAEKVFTAKLDPDGVQRVEITAGSYFFDPNHIIVKINTPVEFKIHKEPGLIPHNLVLKAPEAGINIDLELKDTPQTIRFTPLKTGTYPFYCDKKLLFFESHRDKGMTGVLEVRPK